MLTKQVYLAGSMETAKDGGTGWRSTITPMLKSINYTVFNPCVSEQERLGKTSDEVQRVMSTCKKVGDWDRLKLIMTEIQSTDLSAIDGSDFVIVFLEHMKSHPGGTYEEIMYAKMKGKPVLGLCLGDVTTENSWVLTSCLRSGGLFFSYESLIAYLRKQVDWWGFDWVSNIPKLDEFKK
jgi:nucleoside 2-deoxyribosyltransferase